MLMILIKISSVIVENDEGYYMKYNIEMLLKKIISS